MTDINAVETYKQLKNNYELASNWVSMLGRKRLAVEDGTDRGALHHLSITASIGFNPTDKYSTPQTFRTYMEQVIREQFVVQANAALRLYQEDIRNAAVLAAKEYEKMLNDAGIKP